MEREPLNEPNEWDFDDSFAESLRRDLRDLGQTAPAAPGHSEIRRTLLRRRLRRLGLALGFAAASVLLYLGFRGFVHEETGPDVVELPTIPAAPNAPESPRPEVVSSPPPAETGIRPLQPDATQRELRRRLLAYFDGIEGARGFLSKTPQSGLSLALASSAPLQSRDLGSELEQLLRNFDLVQISISDERIRFSLMRF